MNEFFDPTSTYQRKEEIKQIVNQFARQDNSWCFAIRFICESKSDYTTVFCAAVLHNFIIKNWSQLTEQAKAELKDYIWQNVVLFHLQENSSLFVQNKMCQMLATIVRLSYPNFWASYFTDLADLISNVKTMKLGIRLLNITLEELLMPSDDLFEQRKAELTRLLANQVPTIVNVLASIMRSIQDKYLNSVFVTPPASPIESITAVPDDQEHIIKTNNNKQINLKSICLSIKSLLENIDSNLLEILELILRCNLTLFNWLPINEFYPLLNESMLELLFVFATFGCSNGGKESTIGILTMTCINELLAKNYVFNEYSSKFYLTLFETVFRILQIIDAEFDLRSLDSEYLLKFVDSMRCFVSNQIVYHGDHSFFFAFLEKLFCLTFRPKWNDQYQHFVEIWLSLLDIYILNNGNQNLNLNGNSLINNQWLNENANGEEDLDSKLGLASVELAKQVLIKMQFRFSAGQLEELDTDDMNDYGQTELQIFFNRNVELLSKIAQLIPRQVEKIVGGVFEELVKVFTNIDQLLGQSFSLANKRIITEYLSAEDCSNLDHALKDFAILLRVFQRLSEHFVGPNFKASLPTVQVLLDQILTALDYSNRLKLFTFSCDKQVIVQDLNELHQSLLLSLKFFGPWITQFSNESVASNDLANQNKVNELVKRICDESVRSIIIALEDDCEDERQVKIYCKLIVQSALLCLLSVSYSIKPSFLLELPSVQLFFEKLYSSVNKTTCSTCLVLNDQNRSHWTRIVTKESCANCRLVGQLATLPSAKCTVLRLEREQELVWLDTLSNILLLPWSQLPDARQNWELRSEKHKTLICAFYAELVEQYKQQPATFSQRIPSNTVICNSLKRALFLLTNLVNNHVESPTKSKQQLLASLIEFLEFILNLLPANLLNDDLGEYLLGFLISVLEVFRTQVKLPFMENTVKILLDCISKQNSLLESKPEHKNSLVEKVFRIFIFIVEQPAATFKLILPSMLDVALNQLYPIVQHSNCDDLHSIFYEFLYKFLLNNSKFFFKTSITSSIAMGSATLQTGPEIANEQYFFRIFEIFGNGFGTWNLDLFKQNLIALDALNFRQKLFSRPPFKANLLHHFILLFVQTLLNNEHKILNDELVSILYSLASADYELFKKICLFEFVSGLKLCATAQFNQQYGQLLTKERLEDAPTFNKQLAAFINGVRFYKNANVLLP